MSVDLTIVALLLGVGVSLTALLSPVLKLHSRIDLLEYRVRRMEDEVFPPKS